MLRTYVISLCRGSTVNVFDLCQIGNYRESNMFYPYKYIYASQSSVMTLANETASKKAATCMNPRPPKS